MLPDEGDTRADRVGRSPDDDGFAVDDDPPVVRLMRPIKEVHQRRLAGAVLAHERMDLSGQQIDGYTVNRGKPAGTVW